MTRWQNLLDFCLNEHAELPKWFAAILRLWARLLFTLMLLDNDMRMRQSVTQSPRARGESIECLLHTWKGTTTRSVPVSTLLALCPCWSDCWWATQVHGHAWQRRFLLPLYLCFINIQGMNPFPMSLGSRESDNGFIIVVIICISCVSGLGRCQRQAGAVAFAIS